jgi:hypothetical protein
MKIRCSDRFSLRTLMFKCLPNKLRNSRKGKNKRRRRTSQRIKNRRQRSNTSQRLPERKIRNNHSKRKTRRRIKKRDRKTSRRRKLKRKTRFTLRKTTTQPKNLSLKLKSQQRKPRINQRKEVKESMFPLVSENHQTIQR